jgi:hypothetical protein
LVVPNVELKNSENQLSILRKGLIYDLQIENNISKIVCQNEENMFRSTVVILFIIILSGKTFGQNTYEFLRLDPSPRAAALAGSYVSNTDDPNVIFYNPAGISSLKEKPISFSYFKHLLDINSASLAYSQEFEGIGRFGAGIQYINYGSFKETTITGDEIGEFNASEIAFLVGYSGAISSNLMYGANVKFIYSGIQDYNSTGLAVDLGLQYILKENGWSFGLSVKNAGAQVSNFTDVTEDLPLDVSFGVSKTLPNSPFEFYLALDKLNEEVDNFSDRFQNIKAGTEVKLSKVVHLRFGYDNERRKELKVGSTAGLAGFNLGLGINTRGYKIDYSFSSLGSIGEFHRFGVSTSL